MKEPPTDLVALRQAVADSMQMRFKGIPVEKVKRKSDKSKATLGPDPSLMAQLAEAEDRWTETFAH